MKTTLTNYIKNLNRRIDTVVAIGDVTHWIIDTSDVNEKWANQFDVVSVISESFDSIVISVQYRM